MSTFSIRGSFNLNAYAAEFVPGAFAWRAKAKPKQDRDSGFFGA